MFQEAEKMSLGLIAKNEIKTNVETFDFSAHIMTNCIYILVISVNEGLCSKNIRNAAYVL